MTANILLWKLETTGKSTGKPTGLRIISLIRCFNLTEKKLLSNFTSYQLPQLPTTIDYYFTFFSVLI